MVDFKDARFLDILPETMRDDDAAALSQALGVLTDRVLHAASRIGVRADIGSLSENALDYLAVEMCAPYYTQDMSLGTKRDIVSHAAEWRYHAGTPAAVRELVKAVFGEGRVVEWFENGGEPGTFEIETGVPMSQDVAAQLREIIGNVKNVRSHMGQIRIHREYSGRQMLAGALQSAASSRMNGGVMNAG